MTRTAAAVSTKTAPVDALAVFELRAWARARLFAEGLLDLHHAVDELHQYAVYNNLIAQHGPDFVQHILASIFAEVRP
jgi:hypothetical protein